MNLVVGATGMLGTQICALLADRGEKVRAFVRADSSPQKVANLKSIGANIVVGDLRDERSLRAACNGARHVIATASAMPFSYSPNHNTPATTDAEGMSRLIDAARAASVETIVLTSFSGKIDRPFPLRDAKRAAEDHLRQSGLRYTILRPNFFMEVWLSAAVGFDWEAGRVTIYGDGAAPISWVSLRDVARLAIISRLRHSVENATVEFGGPEPLSPLQAIAIFEGVTGRSFERIFVSTADLQARFDAATDPMEKSFAALMLAYAAGAPQEPGVAVRLGLPSTSVAEYAEGVHRRRLESKSVASV